MKSFQLKNAQSTEIPESVILGIFNYVLSSLLFFLRASLPLNAENYVIHVTDFICHRYDITAFYEMLELSHIH